MRLRSFVLAALMVVLGGLGGITRAQYAPMGGPGGPYGMAGMPGPGMPGPSPYAPSGFAPAGYAGMAGPGPMGSPMGPPMAPMDASMGGMMGGPMGAGPMPGSPDMGGYGGGYCADCGPGGGGGYGGGNGSGSRFIAFGEFLNLRPRNAEVAYAVPIADASIPDVVQAGPISRVDPDYSPGFRFGIGRSLGGCNAFVMTYSQLDSNTFDAVSLPGNGGVLRSLVSHPNPLLAGANGLDAAATLETQFKLLDLDYKGFIADNSDYQLSYVLGFRYANLEQHFAAGFGAPGGFQEVLAESEFDGGGLKFGLEGQRFARTTQFFVYGKGYTSLVAGSFRTRYQSGGAGTVAPVDTSHDVGRLVTMLDLEGGVGWQNFTGNLQFSLGYMFSTWYNTVKVNEWIHTVQQNNFVDPSDNYNGMISFDGLTAKIQVLW